MMKKKLTALLLGLVMCEGSALVLASRAEDDGKKSSVADRGFNM